MPVHVPVQTLLIMGCLMAVALSAPVVEAGNGSGLQPYFMGSRFPDLLGLPEISVDVICGPIHIGGICFDVPPETVSVHLSVFDYAWMVVPGFYVAWKGYRADGTPCGVEGSEFTPSIDFRYGSTAACTRFVVQLETPATVGEILYSYYDF